MRIIVESFEESIISSRDVAVKNCGTSDLMNELNVYQERSCSRGNEVVGAPYCVTQFWVKSL